MVGGGGGIRDFQVVAKLGLGAYGSVYRAVRRVDGRTYAIKRVQLEGLDQQDLAMTLNEIRLLASFRHPRIVRVHEAFLDGTPLHLCVVMEYCGFQDLERKIRRYRHREERVDERVVWVYLVQTLEALQALHSLKILHRDIKPANILLDEEGNAKLGDLNVSKCVDDGGEVQTVVGTLPYMAPELWRGEAYSFSADLYALGCTLFELAALLPPFDGGSALQLQRAVLERRFQAHIPEDAYSQDLRDVIALMMHPDPDARLTAEKLLALPQVSVRLYLVRHKLPDDLPPPTPLTPCAAIDQATVTLSELSALLPCLLPEPSYPPLPPPADDEGEAVVTSPSLSSSPPPPPSSDGHPTSSKKNKRGPRKKKQQPHQHHAMHETLLLLREASESPVGTGCGAPEGSPSSLRALLKSPYPDPAPDASIASLTASATATSPHSHTGAPTMAKQAESESAGPKELLAKTRRRPPSLPTARLSGLLLGFSSMAAAAASDNEEAAADGSKMPDGATAAAASATEQAVDGDGEGDAPWERVPTPTSFAVPLPSPSPASPYQLPPALALSPDGHPQQQQQQQQEQQAGNGGAAAGVIAAEEKETDARA